MLETIAETLRTEPDLALVIVFGSVLTQRMRADSDVDVAVLAREVLSAERKQDLIEKLVQATGRPVDLVDIRTAGVPLRRTALLRGRCVICRDNTLYAESLSRLLAECVDFLPYRERLLEERRRAWID